MLEPLPDAGATLPLLADTSLGFPLPIAIVLFAGGLLGYAVVNAIEIAVVGSNRIRVRAAAEAGSRRAIALERLKNQQDTFFGVVVVMQNVFVFLISTTGAVIAADIFGSRWGFLAGLIAVPLISTEFGEYSPKVIASRSAERIAYLVALPIQFLVVVMKPLIAALAVVPNIFVRGQSISQTVTEAELRMLIDIGAEEGSVSEEEADLLDRVFHFHDRRVNEIMVPRPEIVWLEEEETLKDLLDTYAKSPRSRFPVYKATVDNVVGIVSIKDVLNAIARGEIQNEMPIASLIREALFIPETKLVSTLFWEMQNERQQMAIVVDEYGGVAGLVTLELLLEEMVGRVVDELGQEDAEFVAIDENTTRVDGGMSIFDLRDELGLAIPEGDYETIAGFVLDQLGHIPREGETVHYNSYRIAVSEVKGVKIESVVITKQPEPA
ncbi:MAG: hemolysin family protein [Dehalococcoidia bacterium]